MSGPYNLLWSHFYERAFGLLAPRWEGALYNQTGATPILFGLFLIGGWTLSHDRRVRMAAGHPVRYVVLELAAFGGDHSLGRRVALGVDVPFYSGFTRCTCHFDDTT